jgi:hypothetical protein
MQITMEQVRELAAQYTECGLTDTSSGRFLHSIVTEGRMPRGRGITWLEEIVTKGCPQPAVDLAKEIVELIACSQRQDTRAELEEILRKVRKGWSLSEYQQKSLERLRQQVLEPEVDMVLTERQEILIRGLHNRRTHSSPLYWSSRPAISRRLDSIFKRWKCESKVSPNDWTFLLGNFKSIVAEFENTRHPVGALRWVGFDRKAVTVMREPHFSDEGSVVVDVLTPSGVWPIPSNQLMIRAPK